MTETELDVPRLWTEFPDPQDWDPETEHPHTMIRVDLTWLTSSWSCLFGRGCPGLDHSNPQVACCTLGAHFSEPDDEARTKKWVDQLTPELWQRHPGGKVKKKHWVTLDADGERKTAVNETGVGCVFANDADFPGGSGCALHHLAFERGVSHVETKPDVCWQVPLRRTYRTVTRGDGTEYLEMTIAEYDRRAWGEGGHDLDWWCSGSPMAHDGGKPLYQYMKDELIELMGAAAYAELCRQCDAVVATQKAVGAAKAPNGREFLTFSVHPATAIYRIEHEQSVAGSDPAP